MLFNVLTVMGITVLIAVIGHMLFDKTGVPESIFMITLGLILGPILGIINLDYFSTLISNIFTLSIIIILLESGLTTDINEALATMRTATIFTFIVLVVTSIICSAFLRFILDWPTYPSLILGVICSGTSTLPVLYFTSRMKLNAAINQMLVFESVINDVTIITAVTLIIQAITLHQNITFTILSILRFVSIAVVFGLLFSTIWTLILIKIEKEISLKYLTTLAIAIILHSVTESRRGSGVIAVMIFAITIGNLSEFFRDHLMIRRKVLRFFTQIEVMQGEVTFLVKNTFFFLLGLMFNTQNVNEITVLIALVLTFLMIVSRWISYKFIGYFDNRYINHIWFVSLMVSRGLTAGLAAFMPIEQGLQIPPIADIVIVMILFTNLTATIGFMALSRRKRITL